jgi:uracil phosphoribosyltransferase
LADPMLATWWSLIKVIRKLLQLWIPEDQILIATVISAPEWIDKILSNYPKIKIYTWSLDDHLNEAWYICIWLGDFGDKVTEWITLEYLNALKPYMKNNIFEILVKKLIPEK